MLAHAHAHAHAHTHARAHSRSRPRPRPRSHHQVTGAGIAASTVLLAGSTGYTIKLSNAITADLGPSTVLTFTDPDQVWLKDDTQVHFNCVCI